ncbi:hypothetical protein BUE80_DR002027 [Diplocarpon rosae]|nr:hypothetical protein BUE80_DR002027 [Diplocarpon rosae]
MQFFLYLLIVGSTGSLALPGTSATTKSTGAIPAVPEPSTCPTIRCTSSTRPVYHPEKKSCSCDPVPLVCPNTILCAAGYQQVQRSNTKKCTCELINPIPKTCPQFKCLEFNHVVYHPETGKCGCEFDCPDIVCIAEARPIMDPTTHSCGCQYIPGLEPSVVVGRDTSTAATPATYSTPTPQNTCSEILCIAEKHPVFNATSGLCECEWIAGLEPGGPATLVVRDSLTTSQTSTQPTDPPTPIAIVDPPPSCTETICISEKRPVYNPTSKTCECQWIPGLEPT